MRNRAWWMLSTALLAAIITGCGRPPAAEVASNPLSKDETPRNAAAKPADESAPPDAKKAAETKNQTSELKSEFRRASKKLSENEKSESLAGPMPAASSTPAGEGRELAGGAVRQNFRGEQTVVDGLARGKADSFGVDRESQGAYGGRGGSRAHGDELHDHDNRFVPGGEAYEKIAEKNFSRVLEEPLSTFSIDVDTASYSNVRRFLTQRALPPPDAVRIEELINYFNYDYAPPADDKPFASSAEVAGCPWNPQHRLVRIGLKGKVIEDDARPVSNLVFLIDVSGSMQGSNRLPLVKHALRMLTEKLGENDRVAIVVYAGSAGLVLDSTSGTEKEKILTALDNLQAGGSTNGAGGIQQAYQVAVENFIKGGVNRVILCTDGDFNVGVTDRGQLVSIIENNAKTGVFLSVLGFGMGNLKDATMEQLADKGNGAYSYIDTPLEAKKVLVDQMSGTLVTIAKDVKIQVKFNPAKAAAYRLVGYENRMLAAQDFTDDKKDAGEIGAGHTVTALYEIIPTGLPIPEGKPSATPELKYQKPSPSTSPSSEFSDELLTVKLRYKKPDGDVSTELSFPLKDEGNGFGKATADFRWATSVAAFGMLLRNSESKGDVTLEAVKEWAQTAVGADKNGHRREFLHLLDNALNLAGSTHLSDARSR